MWLTYINRPIEIDASAYDEATDKYVCRVKKLPGIVDVVQFGGVTAPGISDLDLLVIMDDSANIAPSHLSCKSGCHGLSGNVWSHDVSVIPRSLWEDLRHLAYCAYIQPLIRNLDIKQPVLSKAEIFVAMFDALIDRLICIARMLCCEVCNIRTTLLVLHSLKHTLHLCEKADIRFDQRHIDLVDEIQDIRTNWFKKQRPEFLYDLSMRFLNSFYDLVCTISASRWSVVDERIKEIALSPTIQIGVDTYIKFSCLDSGDVELAKRRFPFPMHGFNLRKVTLPLPINLYWHYFLPYLRAMNKTGSSSVIGWTGSPHRSLVPFEEELEQAICRRQTAISKHISFLRHRGFSFGTVHPTAFLPVQLRQSFIVQCKQRLRQLLTDILM
jgi:hypothetical protein